MMEGRLTRRSALLERGGPAAAGGVGGRRRATEGKVDEGGVGLQKGGESAGRTCDGRARKPKNSGSWGEEQPQRRTRQRTQEAAQAASCGGGALAQELALPCIGRRVLKMALTDSAKAQKTAAPVAYVPLESACDGDGSAAFNLLLDELVGARPCLRWLDAQEPINGNRVLADILLPAARAAICRYVENCLRTHAFASELKELFASMAPNGKIRLLGAHWIVPKLFEGRAVATPAQKLHRNVGQRLAVVALGLHTQKEHLNTILRSDTADLRADACSCVFDTAVLHRGPATISSAGEISPAGHRYIINRVFALFCSADLPADLQHAYAADNGFRLDHEPQIMHLDPGSAAGLAQRQGDGEQRADALGVARSIPQRAGRKWSRDEEQELASFEWPLRGLKELQRFLASKHVSPTHLCGCEFTGAMRRALESALGVIVLSVDMRDSTDGGLHFCGPLQDVLECEHTWELAFLWPPCTHQTLSDTRAQPFKLMDGRSFWGIALFIYALTRVRARVVVVEQPDTIIPKYYDVARVHAHVQRVRPSFFGDPYVKPINLTMIGAKEWEPPSYIVSGEGARPFYSFNNAEERDRWRSSWERYPKMCDFLARKLRACDELCTGMENTAQSSSVATGGYLQKECHVTSVGVASDITCAYPSYEREIEAFARAWHEAGLTVPHDYLNSRAQPTDENARAYQSVRGAGDGRRFVGVVPISARNSTERAAPAQTSPMTLTAWADAASALEASVLTLVQGWICVVLVIPAAQPIVLAHANGMSVLAWQLPDGAPRSTPMRVLQHVARLAGGWSGVAFLAGRFRQGPMVGVVPVEEAQAQVVHTPQRRRLLARAGRGFCWCSLAALASCPSYELAAHAWAAVAALRGPLDRLTAGGTCSPAVVPSSWGPFATGQVAATSLIGGHSHISDVRESPEAMLRAAARAGGKLVDALLEAGGAEAEYLAEWTERIQPLPAEDIPPDLMAALPHFESAALDRVPLPPPPPVLHTHRVPLQPGQPHRQQCPQTPLDLYTPRARERVHTRMRKWLQATLEDLLCIADHGEECERTRPRPIAIGQRGMEAWAKDIVWDFTFERHPTCGVPLDFHLPLETHLNLQYLGERLADYPDKQIVGYLLEGVRLEAHVERHAVWIPHLTSLPKGFSSVQKEIDRLEERGWYRSFEALPFFPCYLNGQGATARKLEPWRYRRTTEGGGPRKELTDEEGLRAWSINDASKVYHYPRHLRNDDRPEMRSWVRQQLLDVPESQPPLERGSKWAAEIKPTLSDFMTALSVLKRAAALLGEPIYVFSDDASDFFNQLALSPESWPLFNVAFLAPTRELRFVSERRLGFGCHPASKIAQRFSDALLHLFREDMDGAELRDPDTNPNYHEWVRRRKAAAEASGQPLNEESRLYFAAMFTDDPLIAVVGVKRAVRALRLWRQLTQRSGLLMAIPEKRLLGTWAKWLGVVVIAALGIVVVPRDKLLRAMDAVRRALRGGLDFGEYRSLVGLLEHLRAVSCVASSHMYGLYEPHIQEAREQAGPSMPVVPTYLMRQQLTRWLTTLARVGGASVLAAIQPARLRAPSEPVFVSSADAATDGEHPGMGGFLHGQWWHIAVDERARTLLHITALELLATGINAITFSDQLSHHRHVRLLSDALATPYVLTRHRARSPVLAYIHRALLRDPSFSALAEVAEIAHVWGDANCAADYASRLKTEELAQLCERLGVRMVRVQPPAAAMNLYHGVLDAAEEAGWRVAPNAGRPLEQGPEVRLPQVPSRTSSTALRLQGGGGSTCAGRLARPLEPPQTGLRRANRCAARLRQASRRGEDLPRPQPQDTLALRGTKRRLEPHSVGLSTSAGFAAVPAPRARCPLLRDAAQQQAAARAEAWAASPLLAGAHQERLRDLFACSHDVAAFGSARSTLAKDELAWRHWLNFAEYLGFDPHISPAMAHQSPHEVSALLAGYLLYVYPRMTGKRGRAWAKPRSAFQYVLALLRCFARWDVPMPPARAVRLKVRGLLRAFCVAYGPLALAAHRKEPMLYSMVLRMLALPDGEQVAGRPWVKSSLERRQAERLMLVMWRTAMRLGDLIHPERYSVRADLTWIINMVEYTDPPPHLLKNLAVGDAARLGPGSTKPDQFGEQHAPFASVLPYAPGEDNAAARLAELELEAPCHGPERQRRPLFADAQGKVLTHSPLDRRLHDLLQHCFGTATAATHSWHSFRIGLACALHAAGANDATVQLLCRWLSPESLRLYRRLGNREMVQWVDAAQKARVDTLQQTNVPAVDSCEAFGALLHDTERDVVLRERALRNALAPPVGQQHTSPRRAPSRPTEPEDDEEDSGRVQLPPSDTSPLSPSNAEGRWVLVPRAAWPEYPCDERAGAGWEAIVGRVVRGVARVHFLYAATPRGVPYADVDLRLDVLTPL